MKSILITGVAGLLGSKLSEWLLRNEKSYQIIGIDNLSGGYIEHVPSEVKFYDIDLALGDLTEIFQANQIEYVYHFAAYAAEGLSPFIRKFNYTNNLISTANVVNNCITFGVKRLVFGMCLCNKERCGTKKKQ